MTHAARAAYPMIWVNGTRQTDDAAHVSARDRGLTLADALFETMRARGGIVFRLDRHLARLRRGLAVLQIPEPPDLERSVLDGLRAFGRDDAAVRLTVTRGVGPAGLAPPLDVRPTWIVSVTPLPVFPAETYERGLAAHVASGRRNERSMTAGLKTTAYADAVVALFEARRAGADEALFLDGDGHCSEATASNLFAWTRGALVTPPVSCGALPGMTRAAVLEIAAALDVPAEERVLGADELGGADEAFLTSSLRGIAPLVRVGARAIGAGAPGGLTRRIADAYGAIVRQACAS